MALKPFLIFEISAIMKAFITLLRSVSWGGGNTKKIVLLPKNKRLNFQYWDLMIQLNWNLQATKETQKFY